MSECIKLRLNYMVLIDYHATIIFNNDCESGFAYFRAEEVKQNLIEMFDNDVANDIWERFLYICFEEGYEIGALQK